MTITAIICKITTINVIRKKKGNKSVIIYPKWHHNNGNSFKNGNIINHNKGLIFIKFILKPISTTMKNKNFRLFF